MEGAYLDVAGPAALDHFFPLPVERDRLVASLDHPWARDSVRRLVLRDGHGRHLSYLELHAIRALHLDREIWLGGVSRLVTAEGHRGQGNAGALLRLTLNLLQNEGVAGALLWTEIGSRFFERYGFRVVGTWGVDVALDEIGAHAGGGFGIRAMEDGDRLAVESIHRAGGSGEPLWLLRDRNRWDYLSWRVRHDPGVGRVLERVVTSGTRVVGYAICRIEGERLGLLEFGLEERDPRPLLALIAHLRDDALSDGCVRFVSPWPPGGWGSLFDPLFHPVTEQRPLMIVSLGEGLDVEALTNGMHGYWETDRI